MSARPRGVALLLVLWLVVVLGAIGSSVAVVVRERLHVATNLRDRAAARTAAESGIVSLVQAIQDSLARVGGGAQRDRYLNSLEGGGSETATLGDAHFSVRCEDVNARFDINMADESALARFFAGFTSAVRAREIAQAVRRRTASTVPGEVSRPLLDVAAIGSVAGVDDRLLDAVTPFLTVDGDGNVNLQHAASPVRLVAAGQVVSAPTRVMLVSRGARTGSTLTHEIQAVYAIQGVQLAIVRWREREL